MANNLTSAPLIIAHRGESGDAPENTLAAINLAWARGARAVELDARLTRDGRIAVIHDADTRRIGGPSLAVRNQSLAELHSLDAGSWKHPDWRNERVPSIEDVLESMPSQGRLFIELKDGPESVPPLAAAIRDSGRESEQFLVMSFNEATVEAAAGELGPINRSIIADNRGWRRPDGLEELIARAIDLDCSALNLETHRDLRASTISRVHNAGMHVHTWTVNRLSTARRLARAGIDGITTDRCAWLSERLRE